jgi:hypothetical protein
LPSPLTSRPGSRKSDLFWNEWAHCYRIVQCLGPNRARSCYIGSKVSYDLKLCQVTTKLLLRSHVFIRNLMTSKTMFTRQDAVMETSTAAIPKEHAEKMVQMALGKYVTPSKKEIKTNFSPQAISCRHEFLSETEEPLYSVEQVRTLLRDLVGENKPAEDKQSATATSPSDTGKGKALRMPVATDSPSTNTISADTMPMSTA